LENFDRLAESSAAIGEALIWFDLDSANLHITCLLDSARFFRARDHPDKASSLYNKAIRVGEPFTDTHPQITFIILVAKVLNLSTMYDLGQISLALGQVEHCLEFASKHDLENTSINARLLNVVSLFYRWGKRVDIALSAIRRSIALAGDHPCSWILSDLLADAGEDKEALSIAQEVIEKSLSWKDASRTGQKELYARAQYSLALRAFFNENFSYARQLLLDVRSFYQKYSQARNLWFVKLAVTLQALSLLECASGRHEEGITAKNELNDLRKGLRLIFPSLDGLVEVDLNRERNFAAWKNLLKKFKFRCGHQEDEIF